MKVIKNSTIFAVPGANSLCVGEKFSISLPDERWWKKLVAKVLRQPAPRKTVYYEVLARMNNAEIEAEKL